MFPVQKIYRFRHLFPKAFPKRLEKIGYGNTLFYPFILETFLAKIVSPWMMQKLASVPKTFPKCLVKNGYGNNLFISPWMMQKQTIPLSYCWEGDTYAVVILYFS